jgi:hypothetical protein
MLNILNLKTAGYPFEKNDLSPEEWKDLGRLVDIVEHDRRKQPIPVYMVKIA